MDVEGSTYEYEGTASPTPPPQEYVLPAGAILEKPVVSLFYIFIRIIFWLNLGSCINWWFGLEKSTISSRAST